MKKIRFKFQKSDRKNFAGNQGWIAISSNCIDHDGDQMLSPVCGTLREVELAVEILKTELDVVLATARTKFNVSA